MKTALRRIATLLVALPTLFVGFTAPAHATKPGSVEAAAAWLSTQFADGTHLPAPDGDHFDSKYGSAYYPNYGENADVLFALAAAKVGADKARIALDYLDAHLADYADPSGKFGGPFDGSIAKLALAHLVAGTSATSLLNMLKSDECAAGSKKKCTPGAPANIFASASDSFVILAEARAGGSYAPSAAAVDYFLSLQCASGGFTTGTDACGSGDADIDATSYALMALQALGGHPSEVSKAADWLESQRNSAGYWFVQGVANTDSTGLAAAALAGAGRDVSTSRSWLLAQAIGGGKPGAGALKYAGTFTPTTTSATSPNVIATAQGILGLVDNGSLATVSAPGSTAGVELLAPTAEGSPDVLVPGDTVTVRAVSFAAGEQVGWSLQPDDPHGVTVLGLGGTVVDPAGRVTATIHVAKRTAPGRWTAVLTGGSSGLVATAALLVRELPGTPPPSSTPPPLANTGASTSELLAVGLAALLAGTGLLLLARQRSGRHVA